MLVAQDQGMRDGMSDGLASLLTGWADALDCIVRARKEASCSPSASRTPPRHRPRAQGGIAEVQLHQEGEDRIVRARKEASAG